MIEYENESHQGCLMRKQRETFSPTKGFASDNIVGTSYKHMTIDTVARSKANDTADEQKAIIRFQVDKYINRKKGQDMDDINKIRFYLDWLEEIVRANV